MVGRKLRHRGQAGTTLVELVVSVVIIGLALTLLVGAFSTGVIQSTLVKRNTAVESAMESELDSLSGQLANTYEELSLIYQLNAGMKVNRRSGGFFK